MPIYLRQSTASQEVPLGPFVDDTDGKTAETALSIANTDVKVWASGASTLANKNSGGATHISGGIYYAVLDATDTATVGPLVIFVNMTGALAVRVECVVLHASVYDTLFGSTALSTYAGGAVASVTGAVGSVTGNVGGNVVGSVASVSGNVGGNVVGSVASVTGAVGSVTGSVGGNVAGSVGSVTGNVGGSVASVVGAVGSVTGNVGGNVTGTVASVVGNVGGNVVGSVASVTAGVTVTTNNDKTGYALTAAYDAAKTASQFNANTDGVSLSAGSGTALVNATAAAVTADHGAGSYVRNTEPLDAVGVRDAVGLGSANLDTQLGDIASKTANLPASPAATSDIPTAAAIADTTLRRTMAHVEASGDGDAPSLNSLYGAVQQMQKASVTGATLTVQKTDGTTLGTRTLTSDPDAEPITGVA